MTGLRIRVAAPQDADALAALAVACHSGWTGAALVDELSQPTSQVQIAFSGATPTGFCVTRTVLDEAELLLVAVHPSWRRRGIARGLLAVVESAAKAAGAATIYLEVRASNAAAIELYRVADYRPSGRRPGYYPDGEDARLMEKRLHH